MKPVQIPGILEADSNSIYFQRELPDSGKVELPDREKVELLDGNSPSGSGNEISEMPHSPFTTPLFELGTKHTSRATSSLRRQSDLNRKAIFVSTGIWCRESSDSSGALKEVPCVETKISSSPRHKSLELGRSLPTPPQLTHAYLNRELPSTPDSDSTQVSLTKTSSSSPLSGTNRLRRMSSRTSVTSAHSGSVSSHTPLEMIWKYYDMSWESNSQQEPPPLKSCKIIMPSADRQMREYPSLSSISKDIEMVVPPGTPESQIPRTARQREDERRTHDNFF